MLDLMSFIFVKGMQAEQALPAVSPDTWITGERILP